MKNKLKNAFFTALMLFSFWANAQNDTSKPQKSPYQKYLEHTNNQEMIKQAKLIEEADYILEIIGIDYKTISDERYFFGMNITTSKVKINHVFRGKLKKDEEIEILSLQYKFPKNNLAIITLKKVDLIKFKQFKTNSKDVKSVTGMIFNHYENNYEHNFRGEIKLSNELLDFYTKLSKIKKIRNHPTIEANIKLKSRRIEIQTDDTTGVYQRIQKQVEEGEKKIQEMLELRRKHLVKPIKDSVKVAPKRLNFRDASPMNVTPLLGANYGIKISIQNQKYTVNGATSFVEADLMVEASAANTFMYLN